METNIFFFILQRTRVPGFSDCNLQNMSSIDDSCLYNLPKKVKHRAQVPSIKTRV